MEDWKSIRVQPMGARRNEAVGKPKELSQQKGDEHSCRERASWITAGLEHNTGAGCDGNADGLADGGWMTAGPMVVAKLLY